MRRNGQAPQPSARPSRTTLHRRRFVAPLLTGREVLELRPDAAVPRPGGSGSHLPNVAIVLQLEPIAAAEVPERAAAMLVFAGELGVAAIASDAQLPDAVLRNVAPHYAHYVQRSVSGSLFRPHAFQTSRVAVLRDSPDSASSVHLYLFAQRSLPALNAGIIERITSEAAEERLDAALPPPPPQATAAGVANAVELSHRLLAQESRLLALWQSARRADEGSGQPAASGNRFEPSLKRHPWRLAEQPAEARPSPDPYDRRVDDPAILEARAGEAFFAVHASADAAPACAALQGRANALAPHDGASPDVSIVIPVYGQLAYTLNCLDSLFAHVSRFTAEIIVVDDCSPDETGDQLPSLPQIRYHRQAANGGFIRSCNTGAAMARGHFVLMLNNDTRVVKGWLDALLESFEMFPEAGLVGSKMLYPDGSLQEAGGIIWRDGSAWNYGRNDDPNRPFYAFARQVDYISGCSLALRRADWDRLGGFDPHYHPAYCEDADLCLRVRQTGRQVWFQPQSRVIHYEGKTSGTDLASGAKAYQVMNSKKLFLRWRDLLAGHRPNGAEPYFEKDRRAQKRMLVIDATTPTPDQDAGSLQTVLILQSCRALGYATTFVPQDNFLFQPGYTTALQAAGIECIYAPYEDVSIERYLRRYGKLFDAIIVFRMAVMEKVLLPARRYAASAALIFHVADLHYVRLQRQAALEQDEGLALEALSVRQRELALVEAADCTITHSSFEAETLAAIVPKSPSVVWPLMHPFHGTKIGHAARSGVVFLGGYRHAPNVDAVQHFAADILPRLQRSLPQLRFIAAGANPTPEIEALAREDIVVTGQIADLRDVFDAARVFVCPLRVGAGAKGKIISALSYGLPVVSTSVGIEGTKLEPGTHVLLADDDATFADQVLRLYRDENLWRRLSLAGQDFMRQEYAPESGAGYLSRSIDLAWAHKLGVEAA